MGDVVYLLNTYGVFLLVITSFCYIYFTKNSKKQTKKVLLTLIISTAFALLLKILFNIPRPYQFQQSQALAGLSLQTASLPSLHTTLAFAVASIVALNSDKKIGILFLTLAGIIGFGRVAAQVHYPIDVGLGALLGVAIAFIIEMRVDL